MTARASLVRSLPPVYAVAAVRMLMPLLVLPLVASRLGIEAFGHLGLCLVWAALLALVVEGGFLAAATRRVVLADAGQRLRLAQQVFSARCVLSIPVAVLAFGIGAWAIPVTGSGLGRWELAFALAGLACAQGWPATWYWQGTSQLHRWAWAELGIYGLLIGACLAWAHSVMAFLLLQLLAAIAVAALGWVWLHRQLAAAAPSQRLWQPAELRAGLALGWTMLPVSIAGAGFTLALPAVAAAQLGRGELGLYYLTDRVVRALLAATDPLIQLVYPRIVQRLATSARAALAYAARWSVGGFGLGLSILLVGGLAWPWVHGLLAGAAPDRLAPVFAVSGLLLPLVMGTRLLAYWLLATARYDRAWRASIYTGGVVGMAGAWWLGSSAVALAAVAVAAECAILLAAGLGVLLTRRLRRRSLSGAPPTTSAT